MRKLPLLLAVAAVALSAAPAVLADTPLFATLGDNTGVVDGPTRYVLFHGSGSTTISAITTSKGKVLRQLVLPGFWYFPNTIAGAGGLSRDGKTLLLVELRGKGRFEKSTFIVVDPIRMKFVREFTPYASMRPIPPYALTDALSPDASRLYAVPYTNAITGIANPCFAEYGYDLRADQSVSVKTDSSSAGANGTAVTRASSGDGRWVFTLYRASGSGALFVQALDTVGAAVHCLTLPHSQGTNAVLVLSNHSRTLEVNARGGRPSYHVTVANWHVTAFAGPRAGFPWVWIASGIGGFVLVFGGGGLWWRGRRERQDQHARDVLGRHA
jgi:hypothetical protein